MLYATVLIRKAASEEEAARALHETWQMNAADIAGHHRDLFVRFMLASEKSREALAFSWRSVQQIENRDAEDWTQVILSSRWYHSLSPVVSIVQCS